MTRFLLAAVTVAGALLTATPAANACDLAHCAWSKPLCDARVIDCSGPLLCTYLDICL